MDIGPGDAVVSVWTSEHTCGLCNVREGGVYFVREIVPVPPDMNPCNECGMRPWRANGLFIMGDDPHPTAVRCSCAFRPYHGPEVEREEWLQSKTRPRTPLEIINAALANIKRIP